MRLAFLSDIHFGRDQDLNAYGFAIDLLRQIGPDRIFLGGDIFDMSAVSNYDKTLADEGSLQVEIDEGLGHLTRLIEAVPSAKVQYLQGNHEERIEKRVSEKLRALSSLRNLTLRSVLGLDKIGIEVLPGRKAHKIGHLYLCHGHEFPTGGQSPAHTALNAVNSNVLFGHVHRVSTAHKRQLDGRLIGAWSNSCLSTLTPGWGSKARPDWTQGFSLVDFNNAGTFNVSSVVFWATRDGRLATMIDGKEYVNAPGKAKGVSYDKANKKYKVRYAGESLGYFFTIEEAEKAYERRAAEGNRN